MNEPHDPSATATTQLLARLAHGLLAPGGDLSYDTMKTGLREAALRDPMDTVLVTVLGGSYLFYLAEREENPKVTSFWDALVFVTTCISVGYSDVFARTPSGKAIAAALMTFGPGLATRVFDPPATEAPRKIDQNALLGRIDALVATLEKQTPAAAKP